MRHNRLELKRGDINITREGETIERNNKLFIFFRTFSLLMDTYQTYTIHVYSTVHFICINIIYMLS